MTASFCKMLETLAVMVFHALDFVIPLLQTRTSAILSWTMAIATVMILHLIGLPHTIVVHDT